MQALLRRAEAARLLDVSVDTVKRMEARGELRVRRYGTSVRIHPDEVERLRGGVTAPTVSPTPMREGRHLSAQALAGELYPVFYGRVSWRPEVLEEPSREHSAARPQRQQASTGGAGRPRSARRHTTRTAHQRG